jgi:Domain of unknown function (DUF4124)
MRLLALLMMCAWVGGYACATEVYRTVDAQGRVTYSDRPSPAAQKLDVHTDPRDLANAARLAHDQKIEQAQQADRSREKSALDKQKADEEKQRETRCQRARQHYYSIRDVHRLYHLDDSGNRSYYSDAEADAQRAEAQKSMQAECGS